MDYNVVDNLASTSNDTGSAFLNTLESVFGTAAGRYLNKVLPEQNPPTVNNTDTAVNEATQAANAASAAAAQTQKTVHTVIIVGAALIGAFVLFRVLK